MPSIVALCGITGGINLSVSRVELVELGLTPGSFSVLSGERMEEVRLYFESQRGTLPEPRGGGSVANTIDLIGRVGVSCGVMGVGGDDSYGRLFTSHFERASVGFLGELVVGAVTGYDFYLEDEDGVRTIILTHGANSLVSPDRIDVGPVEGAELVLLDGGALSFGPQSEETVSYCAQLADEVGIPFVLTLAGIDIVETYRRFFHTFAPKAQMVAGNLEQTAVLLGLAPEASLDEVRTELAGRSIDAVVTLDRDGAFARFGEKEFFVSTRERDVVDTTGAGDSFLGAFIVARAKGLSTEKALMVGNIVAGEVIQHDSARLPMGFDVAGLVEEVVRVAEAG